jgi:anti-sigma regulatory factor (Ser/Thr protein kinase)
MIELNISHLSYTEALKSILDSVGDIHNVSCHIEFGADHSQSKIIRDFVGMIFDAHDIHVPWRGRFILITDELINNAIEHGSIEDDLDSCIIEARRDESNVFRISLEVHDTGKGKDSGNIQDMSKVMSTHTRHK